MFAEPIVGGKDEELIVSSLSLFSLGTSLHLT